MDLHDEICDLLARYCHAVDSGDWDAFAELWTRDAVFSAMGNTAEGRDAIVDFLRVAMPPDKRGKHVTTNTAVDVDTASDAVSAVSDFLFVAPGDGPQDWRITQVGRYRDVFARGGDAALRFARRDIDLGLI